MLIFNLLLLFTLFLSTNAQYAALTYPSSMQSARIICTAPVASTSTTYTNAFSTPYVAIPILTLGISSISLTPGLSIDFKATPSAITLTNFNVIIILGFPSTTLFNTINFYYLSIHPTIYNFGIY